MSVAAAAPPQPPSPRRRVTSPTDIDCSQESLIRRPRMFATIPKEIVPRAVFKLH
jgi:hypothetical protein